MPSPLAILRPLLPLLAAGFLFIILLPWAPFSLDDARTVLLQSSIVAIVALAAALVIVSAGLDLSVGSSLALASITAALIMQCWPADHPIGLLPAALVAAGAIATGALCGLYNGLLITAFRIPPFIVTLGTLGFFRGVAKLLSHSSPIYSRPGPFAAWVALFPSPPWLLVAPAFYLALAAAALIALFLHRTIIGRRTVAIGSNEEAARRCGIPIARTKIIIYTLAGALTGLAGLLQFARLGGSGDPGVQVGLELKAIAAVVIGGGLLSGGHISIIGALAGAVLMSLLDNRCTALGLPNYAQEILVGHIIIIAVAAERWRRPEM